MSKALNLQIPNDDYCSSRIKMRKRVMPNKAPE